MKEQADSYGTLKYAARLAEERRRVAPHQGNFAASAGLSQARQSLYERGERDLRVEYLDRMGQLGLDVRYIVTGHRSGDMIDEESSELVALVRDLDADQRRALIAFLASLVGGRATMHSPASTYGVSPAAGGSKP